MAIYGRRFEAPQRDQQPASLAPEVELEEVLRGFPVGPPGLLRMSPSAGVFPDNSCSIDEESMLHEARVVGQMRYAQEAADDEELQEQADALTSAAMGFGGGLGMARSKFTKSGRLRKKPGPVPKAKPMNRGDLSRYAAPNNIDGLYVFSAELLKQRGSATAISKLRDVENLLASEGVTSRLSANETVTHLYMESIRLPEAALPNPAKFARTLAERLRGLGIEDARFGEVRFARSNTASTWFAEEEALLAEEAKDARRARIAHQELRRIFPPSGEADLWRP